jgi:Zn-dependent peptidase ImmA (M78 family)
VKRIGGTIEFLPWEGWLKHENDTISVEGPHDFKIRLMGTDGPLRHRFTIAHELGHYFLHSKQGKKPIQVGRDGSNTRLEWEANWFAAAFLMPEPAFREAAKLWKNDPLGLAGKFLVSVEAVKVRMGTLGIQ